ncbi:hypothetical protein TNIN_257111 [Trichonephila inaurata madagascariensis]|uniref:Uncharacterized protein n=1 Tax=Trichonephila inaurata madagascariensis TaxID=2747483 RepID=A0A8X6YFW5_9ARAC|nr:hypothetical protein TNIN_257111 [Trichonephila inaurata madagascariensis]
MENCREFGGSRAASSGDCRAQCNTQYNLQFVKTVSGHWAHIRKKRQSKRRNDKLGLLFNIFSGTIEKHYYSFNTFK